MASSLRDGSITGVASTIVMDVSNVLWSRLGVRGIDPPLFGKWLDAMLAGRFVSADLPGAPPSTRPPVLGLALHYAIGVALAIVFVMLLRRTPVASARPMLAGVLFGVATSLFAWLFMFPSMGFGAFGAHPPAGYALFTSSLLRHLAYGIGLGLMARFFLVRRQ
jgi:hypothetical protein